MHPLGECMGRHLEVENVNKVLRSQFVSTCSKPAQNLTIAALKIAMRRSRLNTSTTHSKAFTSEQIVPRALVGTSVANTTHSSGFVRYVAKHFQPKSHMYNA